MLNLVDLVYVVFYRQEVLDSECHQLYEDIIS